MDRKEKALCFLVAWFAFLNPSVVQAGECKSWCATEFSDPCTEGGEDCSRCAGCTPSPAPTPPPASRRRRRRRSTSQDGTKTCTPQYCTTEYYDDPCAEAPEDCSGCKECTDGVPVATLSLSGFFVLWNLGILSFISKSGECDEFDSQWCSLSCSQKCASIPILSMCFYSPFVLMGIAGPALAILVDGLIGIVAIFVGLILPYSFWARRLYKTPKKANVEVEDTAHPFAQRNRKISEEDFCAADKYEGSRPGWSFKTGELGLGYYREEKEEVEGTGAAEVPQAQGEETSSKKEGTLDLEEEPGEDGLHDAPQQQEMNSSTQVNQQ